MVPSTLSLSLSLSITLLSFDLLLYRWCIFFLTRFLWGKKDGSTGVWQVWSGFLENCLVCTTECLLMAAVDKSTVVFWSPQSNLNTGLRSTIKDIKIPFFLKNLTSKTNTWYILSNFVLCRERIVLK